jgi:hypothetical protein
MGMSSKFGVLTDVMGMSSKFGVLTDVIPLLTSHSGPEYLKSWPKIDFMISSN